MNADINIGLHRFEGYTNFLERVKARFPSEAYIINTTYGPPQEVYILVVGYMVRVRVSWGIGLDSVKSIQINVWCLKEKWERPGWTKEAFKIMLLAFLDLPLAQGEPDEDEEETKRFDEERI